MLASWMNVIESQNNQVGSKIVPEHFNIPPKNDSYYSNITMLRSYGVLLRRPYIFGHGLVLVKKNYHRGTENTEKVYFCRTGRRRSSKSLRPAGAKSFPAPNCQLLTGIFPLPPSPGKGNDITPSAVSVSRAKRVVKAFLLKHPFG